MDSGNHDAAVVSIPTERKSPPETAVHRTLKLFLGGTFVLYTGYGFGLYELFVLVF